MIMPHNFHCEILRQVSGVERGFVNRHQVNNSQFPSEQLVEGGKTWKGKNHLLQWKRPQILMCIYNTIIYNYMYIYIIIYN